MPRLRPRHPFVGDEHILRGPYSPTSPMTGPGGSYGGFGQAGSTGSWGCNSHDGREWVVAHAVIDLAGLVDAVLAS